MEYRAIRFLNKFKSMDCLISLSLIGLADHWIHKLRKETTYPDFGYLSKFFPSELTSFIGILIILRCFSLSRHGMVKYVASISIFTLLEWIACSVEYWEVIFRPTCFILQIILVAYRSYQFHRSNATYLKNVRRSTAIFALLKLSEIRGYKLFFTDHVILVYLTAIMLPEGLIPTLTPEEKSKLTSLNDHLSVFHARLHILKGCSFFSVYWLLFRFFKLIIHAETGNVWGELFNPRLESPFEVFAMVWVVTFVTYYISNLLRVHLFSQYVLWDSPSHLIISCQLFVFLLDDGIWNVEPDQQWETIRLTLFFPLIQILLELESWSRFFIYQELHHSLSVECARVFAKVMCFCITCPLVIIVWMCAWFDEFNALLFFVALSALKLLGVVIAWTLSVLDHRYNPDCGAKHCADFYVYLFICLEELIIITAMVIETLVLIYIALPVWQVPGFFRFYELGINTLALCKRWKELQPVLREKVWRISRFIYGLRNVRGSQSEVEERGVCPICRDEMNVACITSCNHYYHPRCLEEALYKSDGNNYTCPICKRPLLLI